MISVDGLGHLLDVMKALDLDDPEARHMQLPCSIRVDLYVQFLSILTQQVSKKYKPETTTIS